MALLSEREAMDYRWNKSVNTRGGIGKCIPNDTFVETQVKKHFKNMARQGPNKSFKTAQITYKITQIVTQIKSGFQKLCGQHEKRGKHKIDTTKDVIDIANAFLKAGLVENHGQTVEGYESFTEPLISSQRNCINGYWNKKKLPMMT